MNYKNENIRMSMKAQESAFFQNELIVNSSYVGGKNGINCSCNSSEMFCYPDFLRLAVSCQLSTKAVNSSDGIAGAQ